MVKQTIQIFCRVKPSKTKTAVRRRIVFNQTLHRTIQVYEIDPVESGANLSIVIPKELTDGYVNNKREDFRFR